jgi:hypothetical protein
MEENYKEIHILKTVRSCGPAGFISLPRKLVEKEVEIIFKEPLTEDEMEELRKRELKKQLTILKNESNL